MSTERVIVQCGVAEKLMAAVNYITSKLVVRDPQLASDSDASVGPVFSEAHAKGIVSLVRDAKENGAELILGDLSNHGAIVRPHILKNVRPGMRVWDQESFGPGTGCETGNFKCYILTLELVVGFITVDTIDEAVELANSSTYSLTASLWTKSIDGLQIASRIRAGQSLGLSKRTLTNQAYNLGTVVINGNTYNSEPSFGNFGLG